MKRDTSRDGFGNKLQTFALTNFKPIWGLVQSIPPLAQTVNKALINNAIYKIPTRPYPFSLMTLERYIPGTDRPKQPDTYTSWESLIDRTYTGRHLPPDPVFNQPENLPPLEDLAVFFRKQNGETIYSEKSTLLFPYWVQWFTDGFLRTDRHNRLKNTSNHHIDLCTVYGLTPEKTHMLRSFVGGKLKSQMIGDEEYPPFVYEDPEKGTFKPEFAGLYDPINSEVGLSPERKAKLFAMGVERANVQIGFVTLNVLCLREHNRLCDLLAKHYPTWDDERLFQTARNIVLVVIMRIVIEDYINHITPYHFQFITDPLAFKNERWYRQNWMTEEFSLVYRWHSALPETFVYDGQQKPMVESLWNNQMLIDKGIGALMEETSSQPATKIGLFNTPEFPIGTDPRSGKVYTYLDATELASIQLGRFTQMASYNDYRAMCGFPRVTAFDQITGDPRAQELLERFYKHVDKIELYVGLYAEDVRPKSALPPLIGRLVGIDAFSQALTNPLLAEHIFNPDTFSPIGWEIIHTTKTLADLVNRNVPARDRPYTVTFYR